MSSASVMRALSVVAGCSLRSVTLVRCEVAAEHYAANPAPPEDLLSGVAGERASRELSLDAREGVCYLCLSENDVILMDRAMRGRHAHGMFIAIPYTAITDVVLGASARCMAHACFGCVPMQRQLAPPLVVPLPSTRSCAIRRSLLSRTHHLVRCVLCWHRQRRR